MNTLELKRKYDEGTCREFYCALTEMLDKGSSMTKGLAGGIYKHYVLVDDWSLNERRLAIRLPGRTWGGIGIDADMVVTDIVMDETGFETNTRPYSEDLLRNIQQFVGCRLTFPE